MWQIAGASLTLRLPLLKDGVPRIPDDEQVVVSLRDGAGALMSGFDHTVVPCASNVATIVIPALLNTLVAADFDVRFVTVEYLVDGLPLSLQHTYRITPFLPISATPQTVRALVGLTPEELEDGDLDFYEAYYRLVSEVTGFATLLTGGGVNSLKANEAVGLKALLLIVESIPNRIGASQETENNKFARLSKLDPAKLQMDLQNRLGSLLNELVSTDLAANLLAISTFQLSTPTDPVTNT